MPIEALILLGLIALNGAVRDVRDRARDRAPRAAAGAGRSRRSRRAAAMELHDEPTRFLSTVQIGITSIGILNGIVGEAAFAAAVCATGCSQLGVKPGNASLGATALVVVVITFFTIVFGELVPKRLGQISAGGDRAPRRAADGVAGAGRAAVRPSAVVVHRPDAAAARYAWRRRRRA